MSIPEGYFTVKSTYRTEDCDYGPCTGRFIAELGLTFFTYDNHPDTVSFHLDIEEDQPSAVDDNPTDSLGDGITLELTHDH